jgi:hypothetical protein
MRVEIAIARGDPQSPQGWTVSQPVFMVVFPFENRTRIGWLFNLIAQLGFDHDDIMVLSVDASLTAALIDRVREIRDRTMPGMKVCLLDGGLILADLTPNQIRARVG